MVARFFGPSRTAALCLSAGLIFACGGQRPDVEEVGERFSFSETSLIFGDVFVFGSFVRTVTIENEGAASVQLERGAAVEGFVVEPISLSVPAGGRREVSIRFAPKRRGSHEGAVVYRSKRGNEASIEVRGNGTLGAIVVEPATLDFGALELGEERSLDVQIESRSDREIVVQASTRGALDFEVEAGTISLAPRGRTAISVRYLARNAGAAAGSLELRPCSGCETVNVALEAEALRAKLEAHPPAVDFGPVHPPLTNRWTVNLLNTGTSPLAIEAVELSDEEDTPFSLSPLEPQVLEPGGSLQVEVIFAPAALERNEATLSVVGRNGLLLLEIPVSGRGGGRLLEVTSSVDFGTWPQGFEVPRTITFHHVGSDDTIEIVDLSLEGGGAGAFSFTEPTEPIVVAAGEAKTLEVRFFAGEAAAAAAELVVVTDHSLQGDHRIPLEGSAYEDGCELTVTPDEDIRLGAIDATDPHPLHFEILHGGSGDCVIWDVGVEAEGGMFASRRGNPPGFLLLDPGVPHEVEIEVSPVPRGPYRWAEGTLFFHHSTKETPRFERAISAYRVTPLDLDHSPPSLEFPPTPLGRFSVLPLTVWNDGFGVVSVAFDHPAFSRQISYVQNPGETQVRFTPAALGGHEGYVELWRMDLDEPVLVPASGEGLPACEDCGWPELEFVEVEFVTVPLSPPWEAEMVFANITAAPSASGFECRWTVTAPSGSPVTPQHPGDPCEVAQLLANVEGNFQVEVAVIDGAGRGGIFETTVTVPPLH